MQQFSPTPTISKCIPPHWDQSEIFPARILGTGEARHYWKIWVVSKTNRLVGSWSRQGWLSLWHQNIFLICIYQYYFKHIYKYVVDNITCCYYIFFSSLYQDVKIPFLLLSSFFYFTENPLWKHVAAWRLFLFINKCFTKHCKSSHKTSEVKLVI